MFNRAVVLPGGVTKFDHKLSRARKEMSGGQWKVVRINGLGVRRIVAVRA